MADIATLGIRIDASSAERAAQSLSKLEQSANQADRSVSVLKTAFAGLAGALSARELSQAADSYQSITAALEIATGSASRAADAYAQVLDISRRTGQNLEQVATVYRRFATVSEEIGISQAQVAATTGDVANAMAVSMVSASSANAALVQFAQGLASGTLRGEEFNSVMEQAPRLAQALAEGLGVGLGQLRALATEGKITSQAIVQALNSQSETLRQEAAKLPLTFARALENLRTEFVDTVGSFEESSGVFRGLASIIQALANNMDALAVAASAVGAVYAGKLLTSMAGIVAAQVTATASARALAVQEVATAEATLAMERASLSATIAMNAQTLTANGLAAAQARVSTASTALAAAQARLGAIGTASRLAGAAVGALGGPFGLLLTALSAGATAWALWGDSTERANDQAAKSVADTHKEIISSLDKQIERLRERADLAEKGMPTLASRDTDATKEVIRLQKEMEAIQKRTGQYQGIGSLEQNALLQAYGLQLANVLSKTKELETQQDRLNKATNASKAAEWLGKYGTEAQKVSRALAEARKELGAAFSPEIGKQILSRFTDIGSVTSALKDMQARIAEVRMQGQQAVANLSDQAQQRRNADLPQDQVDEQNRRNASILSAKATLAAGEARAAAQRGELQRAQQIAEQATNMVERAAKSAQQIGDNDIAARQFDELARVQQKITDTQVALKQTEADQIELAKERIEGLISALTQPVAINIDTDGALKQIDELQKRIDSLKGGTYNAPQQTPESSGTITMGDRTATVQNQPAFEPYAQPKGSGGTATMGGRTIVLDMGSLGRYETTADQDVARSLERALANEARRAGN